MNITEDYVSFEVAKLLKERGFDEKTLSYYEDNVLCRGDWFEWNRSPLGHIAAPTHQMAMKWFREEKNIIVNVWYNGVDWDAEYYNNEDENFYPITDSSFNSYEEAVGAALKYVLENLENLM